MAKVKKHTYKNKEYWWFDCPGCGARHKVDGRWSFNGDVDKPTFRPSFLASTGHYVNNGAKGNCWCDYEERTGEESPFECGRCHSFVTDGKIQFLNDSTHDLAGQTVELPEIE